MSTRALTSILISTAGILGMAGVATGAAGAHSGGGDLAQLASTFFLLHAAAICGITAVAELIGWASRLCRLAAATLAIGTAAFAGDLAAVGLTGTHVVRGLAPLGGSMLLAGWALLAAVPIFSALFRKSGDAAGP